MDSVLSADELFWPVDRGELKLQMLLSVFFFFFFHMAHAFSGLAADHELLYLVFYCPMQLQANMQIYTRTHARTHAHTHNPAQGAVFF